MQVRPPKKLLEQWNKKLKDSGFEDVELDEHRLKEYHSSRFVSMGEEFREKQRYYQLASQLLHTYPFMNPQSKAIWRMHSGGENVASIVKATGVSKFLVEKLIKRLQGHIRDI